jgi:hypothetical protein
MQRERMAQEEKEKERIELEKREEEVRKNEQGREQDEIRWKATMEEKKKRQREADIVHERAERNRMEYEERERKRHEAEEELNRQREEDFQKRLKHVSPFIAITQTVPGGILKTPRTNASTPRDLVVRSNVATPSSTGYTTPSRPASTVEPSSYFKPPVRGATAPPPPVVSKEREVGSKEWIQNFELGRASTPIRRPIAMLAATPVSNTPFGRTANFSMEGYDETPAMKIPYVGGLTSERDLKEYLARK